MAKIEKLLVLALLLCCCRNVSFLFQGNNLIMPDRQPVDPYLPATQIYEQVRVSPSCLPSLISAPTPGQRTLNAGRTADPGPWANNIKLESPNLYAPVGENNNGYVNGQPSRLLAAAAFGEITVSASKDVFVPVLPPPYDPRPTITYAQPQPVNVLLPSKTEIVPIDPQPPISVGYDQNSYIPKYPNYPQLQVPQAVSSNQPNLVDGVITSPPSPSSMGLVSDRLPEVASIKTSYGDYVRIFKPYSSRTDGKYGTIYRQIIFNERVNKINQHNTNKARTYNMGLNLFTDRNQQELRQLYSNFKPISRTDIRINLVDSRNNGNIMMKSMPSASPINRVPDNQRISSITDPDPWNIDWRCVGSPVYFIGDCGACSFFSTVDALYNSLRIWGYNPATYSFQAPLSCMNANFQNVCLDGGNFLYVYEYVRKYGVGAGSAYPYTDTYNAIDASPCSIDKLKSSAYRKKLIYTQQTYLIEENDCREVVDQLRTRALTVAIIANQDFTNYKQGTFSYDPSLQEVTNHAVVLMGYHPTKGYLIKNMWGSGWGISGYAYLPRESGVCTWAVYAKQFYQLY